MQLAWTHLLPATFGGRAKMNVQNSLAAAGAAFAAGAHLHDIRQGLRTFTTSYYLSPGRLNQIEVGGTTVIVDYCHNAPGHADARRLRRADGRQRPADLRAGQAAADRRGRHRRRPARRGHARAGLDRGRALRRARRPRGPGPARPASAARSRPWSPRAPGPGWPRARAASRSRSSSRRSRPCTTRWRAPTPATSWCSASTSTAPCSPSWRRCRSQAQAGAHVDENVGDPDTAAT